MRPIKLSTAENRHSLTGCLLLGSSFRVSLNNFLCGSEPRKNAYTHTAGLVAFMLEGRGAVNSGLIISRSISNQLTNKLGHNGLRGRNTSSNQGNQGKHFFFEAGSDGRLLCIIGLGYPACG
jgi:hypothetical protein